MTDQSTEFMGITRVRGIISSGHSKKADDRKLNKFSNKYGTIVHNDVPFHTTRSQRLKVIEVCISTNNAKMKIKTAGPPVAH